MPGRHKAGIDRHVFAGTKLTYALKLWIAAVSLS
jgi:hypothetical protein